MKIFKFLLVSIVSAATLPLFASSPGAGRATFQAKEIAAILDDAHLLHALELSEGIKSIELIAATNGFSTYKVNTSRGCSIEATVTANDDWATSYKISFGSKVCPPDLKSITMNFIGGINCQSREVRNAISDCFSIRPNCPLNGYCAQVYGWYTYCMEREGRRPNRYCQW